LRIIKKSNTDANAIRPFLFPGQSGVSDEAGMLFDEPSVIEPAASAEQSSRIGGVDPAEVEKAAYESGFRQGERAGMDLAEKKLEVMMRRYADAIGDMGRLRAKLYAQVEREVVRLAVEVAKKIVHREIRADREIIQTLVKVALSHVADKSSVTVHLHPVDYSFILERRGELLDGAAEGRELVLLADKSVERGGCLIQTECGDVDARIEEEFREVERAFFQTPD